MIISPIFVISFFTAFLVISLVSLWVMMGAKQKRQAMVLRKMGASGSSIDGDANQAAMEHSARQKDIAKKLKSLSESQDQARSQSSSLAMKLGQAGLKMSVKGFWVRSIVFGLVLTGIAFGAGLNILVCIGIGVTAMFGLPRMILSMMAKGRQKAFLRDFADALEAMVRLLKSGMPVGEAIAMVAREFTGPIAEEMQQIYQSQKVGISLQEACEVAAQRMPLPEMQMLATGITIQSQTGSSLSEALQNLADLIRARHRLKRKIVALSSEAKTSAMIIGALPILVGTMLYIVNPDYTGLLFSHPTGQIMITGAGIWMSIGVFIMKGMINFKI